MIENFTIDKLAELKKILNYTHSAVKLNNVNFDKMCFIYFNDNDECVEIHLDKMYEFVKSGNLNRNTLIFSIDYKTIINEKMMLEFTRDNKLEKIIIGFLEKFEFRCFHKKTSHLIAGVQSGLFTVENGFAQYHNYLQGNN